MIGTVGADLRVGPPPFYGYGNNCRRPPPNPRANTQVRPYTGYSNMELADFRMQPLDRMLLNVNNEASKGTRRLAMLLIDGVKYELWTPTDEDELESMVQEHATDIFGPDCIYFDLKHKLKGNSVAAIPDGYAITFNPDHWWIIEVELSTHPVYEHIQNQVGKFIAALPNPNTRPEVINAMWQEINANKTTIGNLQNKKGNEVYKWLFDLVTQPPQLAIIIEKKADGLDDAISALKIEPKIVEFATYTRENVGLAVHGHRFEPLINLNKATGGKLEVLKPIYVLKPPPTTHVRGLRLYRKDGQNYNPKDALKALGATITKWRPGSSDLKAELPDGTILEYIGATKNGKSKIPKVHEYLLAHGFTFRPN